MVQVDRVRTYGVNQARQSKKGKDAHTFDIGDTEEAEATSVPKRTHTVAETGALSVLMQLQEIVGYEETPQTYIAYGEEMLESLDCLHLDILSGGINEATLKKISSLLSSGTPLPTDPQIREVLALIRQRAEVELAKIEMSHPKKV